MSGELFDLDAYGIKPVPTPPAMNRGERLRARQSAKIAAGEHPLSNVGDKPSRVLLAPEGTGTCGTCAHKMRPAHHGRAYPKCAADAFRDPAGTGFREVWPRAAHSESTDVRAWWPACTTYEPQEPTDA
jgi:hypothetical protein